MSKARKPRPTGTEYDTKVGQAVNELGLAMEGYRQLAVDVTGMSIRSPTYEGDEYLAVVRATDDEGGPIVGFQSALDLGELLRGINARLRNGSFKWKVDEFAT